MPAARERELNVLLQDVPSGLSQKNRLRSEYLCDGHFEELFSQTVVIMNEEGLVSLKVQHIDGTEIESLTNKYTFVWKGSIEKNKTKPEAKIDAMLKDSESVLAEENGECSAE